MPETEPTTGRPAKARVLLVDDHEVVRFGIAQLINHQEDMTVCGEAADAPAALQAIATLRPDLVTVDLSLNESDGLELLKDIHALHPDLPLLVVTMHDEALYAELALHAGARGYIMKREPVARLLAALRRVMHGAVYVSDDLATRLILNQSRARPTAAVPNERLSHRELQVFQLIGQWKSTRTIAAELHLSIKTVEYYREQIKKKLSLRNASELIQSARHWIEHAAAA
jgi:DNA-binding NarL/FixJ family response regulator